MLGPMKTLWSGTRAVVLMLALGLVACGGTELTVECTWNANTLFCKVDSGGLMPVDATVPAKVKCGTRERARSFTASLDPGQTASFEAPAAVPVELHDLCAASMDKPDVASDWVRAIHLYAWYWLLLGLIGGLIGWLKRRPIKGVLYGLFLGPLGWIATFGSTDARLGTCGACDGLVPQGAQLCPHCQSPVEPPESGAQRRRAVLAVLAATAILGGLAVGVIVVSGPEGNVTNPVVAPLGLHQDPPVQKRVVKPIKEADKGSVRVRMRSAKLIKKEDKPALALRMQNATERTMATIAFRVECTLSDGSEGVDVLRYKEELAAGKRMPRGFYWLLGECRLAKTVDVVATGITYADDSTETLERTTNTVISAR